MSAVNLTKRSAPVIDILKTTEERLKTSFSLHSRLITRGGARGITRAGPAGYHRLNNNNNNASVWSRYTKDEKPGSGARDLALLFMTSWVPLRLTTALLPSWSLLSVKLL